MVCKVLRKICRGNKRKQVKSLIALILIFSSASLLGLAILGDCRIILFSSKCEPEYVTIKLNDTIVNMEYPTISRRPSLKSSSTARIYLSGADSEKLLQNISSKAKYFLKNDSDDDADNIVKESEELRMDQVFTDRRDSTALTCMELNNEALEKEKKNPSVKKRVNPHVSFSVGHPIPAKASSLLEKTEQNLTRTVKNRERIINLGEPNPNLAGVGKPRYFQSQMKAMQNRWVHYHRIIKSTSRPAHSKVVEIKWCPLFKAASTAWLALFTRLSNALTERTEAAINKGKMGFLELARTHRLFTPRRYDKEIHPVKSSMVVVRHPFKRLLSGYKDKIERVKGRIYYYNKYSTKILRKFRSNKPSQLERMSKDKDYFLKIPTFQEFVKFILSFTPKRWDEHWRPSFLDCNPCQNNFDFILKVETLDSDMKKVLKFLRINETDPEYKGLMQVWDRWNNPSNIGRRDPHKNDSFYFSQLKKQEMKELYQVYEPDFRLFGYSPEPYFSMATKV